MGQAICFTASLCSLGESIARRTAAVIETKPMFLSKARAISATPTKATSVSTWSRRTPRAWVPVGAEVPIPRAGTVAPPRCRSSASVSGSSGSIRWLISLRPPSAMNRITASTVLTTRLARKMTISLDGRPASSITELVIVP